MKVTIKTNNHNIIAALGYFGNKQVTAYMAGKIVDQVAKTLTPSEVAKLTNDPEMTKQARKLEVEPNNFTLQDKKEAMTIVTKNFSTSVIKDIAKKWEVGTLHHKKN